MSSVAVALDSLSQIARPFGDVLERLEVRMVVDELDDHHLWFPHVEIERIEDRIFGTLDVDDQQLETRLDVCRDEELLQAVLLRTNALSRMKALGPVALLVHLDLI